MKTFVEFISECYFFLFEEEKKGRSGPKYNYEVALVNLYNHLIKGTNKGDNRGKILRGIVSRGDTEELTDFLAQELKDAKNNEKHPLHFNNVGNEGFTGGKKTDAHRDSYYSELEDQFYTFLNDSQSKLGRKLISQGYTVKRLGDDKIPLSKSGKSAYGKESDTSKADIVFQHPTRPERENYSSLKKASGAVSASAGAEETAGNYTVGMRNALRLALKSGNITKEQAKELEAEGNTRISALRDAMSGSKGMSKEQQKNLLPQLDSLRKNIEDLIPGTERETAKAQLSGAGKFQKAIDSFLSTGKGGGRKKKPEEVSGTHQRMRLGKGSQKTAEGGQRPVTSTGDIKPPKTGEPSTFASFSKQAAAAAEAQHAQTAAELEQQVNQASANVSAAQAELEKANDPSELRYSDGTKPLLQHRKRFQDFITNNPTEPSVKKIVQRRKEIENKFSAAQTAANDATNLYQNHISTPPTVQPQQQKQPQQQAKITSQQPQKSVTSSPTSQVTSGQSPIPQPTPQQPTPEPEERPSPQQSQQQVSPEQEQKKRKQKPQVEISPEQTQ